LFNSKQIEIHKCLLHLVLDEIIDNFIVKDLVSLINEKVKLMASIGRIELFFLGSIQSWPWEEHFSQHILEHEVVVAEVDVANKSFIYFEDLVEVVDDLNFAAGDVFDVDF
jgi:hypothetical protein